MSNKVNNNILKYMCMTNDKNIFNNNDRFIYSLFLVCLALLIFCGLYIYYRSKNCNNIINGINGINKEKFDNTQSSINLNMWQTPTINIAEEATIDNPYPTKTINNPLATNISTDVYLSQSDPAYTSMDLVGLNQALAAQQVEINNLATNVNNMLSVAQQSSDAQKQGNLNLINILNSIETSALFDKLLEYNNLAYKMTKLENKWAHANNPVQ